MDEYSIVEQFMRTMNVVAAVGFPPLLGAMIVGVIVAIIQSATQIQDQTLPLTVKLFAVGAMLAIFGAALARPLITFAAEIFEQLAYVAH